MKTETTAQAPLHLVWPSTGNPPSLNPNCPSRKAKRNRVQRIANIWAAAAFAFSSVAAGAADISLETAPPVVVQTEPVAGASDVSSALTEIVVTYSKTMQPGSWSWTTWGNENFPEQTGEPRYLADGRTCVLPVKLVPGKFYAIWLNSEKFKNFKDRNGRSAVPYLLTFVTGKSGANSDGQASSSSAEELVQNAVTTISQCTEADPKVEAAVKSLKRHNTGDIVRALVPHLNSSKDTERRSAIFILWRGEFRDITPAADDLQKLLNHEEDLTRGMAALALGQNKIKKSFDALGNMLKDDKSGYARRCAAYALGLMGDQRAKPLLEAALKDADTMVRNNANAAIDLLKKAQGGNEKGLKQSGQTSPGGSDNSKAVALFQKIDADRGQKFEAAIKAKNVDAANKAIRHMIAQFSNYNAAVEPDLQFPEGMVKDLNLMLAAIERGDWTRAQELSRHNEEYAARYRSIARRVGDLALKQKLNEDQLAVLNWTDRQFGSYFDNRTFEGMSQQERNELETRLLDQLKGPRNRDYYTAINSLAAMQSSKALEPLRAIAFDRAEKDNRDRWMAVRALGIMGDKPSVPEMIHLVYHGNVNTRWWAQISLVRLTGENYGGDWKAWGQWWTAHGGHPAFSTEMVRWSKDPEWGEPAKLEKNLAESDHNFLEKLRSAQ